MDLFKKIEGSGLKSTDRRFPSSGYNEWVYFSIEGRKYAYGVPEGHRPKENEFKGADGLVTAFSSYNIDEEHGETLVEFLETYSPSKYSKEIVDNVIAHADKCYCDWAGIKLDKALRPK